MPPSSPSDDLPLQLALFRDARSLALLLRRLGTLFHRATLTTTAALPPTDRRREAVRRAGFCTAAVAVPGNNKKSARGRQPRDRPRIVQLILCRPGLFASASLVTLAGRRSLIHAPFGTTNEHLRSPNAPQLGNRPGFFIRSHRLVFWHLSRFPPSGALTSTFTTPAAGGGRKTANSSASLCAEGAALWGSEKTGPEAPLTARCGPARLAAT